jgi:hypothetical protein
MTGRTGFVGSHGGGGPGRTHRAALGSPAGKGRRGARSARDLGAGHRQRRRPRPSVGADGGRGLRCNDQRGRQELGIEPPRPEHAPTRSAGWCSPGTFPRDWLATSPADNRVIGTRRSNEEPGCGCAQSRRSRSSRSRAVSTLRHGRWLPLPRADSPTRRSDGLRGQDRRGGRPRRLGVIGALVRRCPGSGSVLISVLSAIVRVSVNRMEQAMARRVAEFEVLGPWSLETGRRPLEGFTPRRWQPSRLGRAAHGVLCEGGVTGAAPKQR